MANDGDYPFYVKVRNRFVIGENRPKIQVKHHYYSYGEGPVDSNDEPSRSTDYTIIPGAALGFPLHWRKEYLEITISGSTSNIEGDYYYVWCGTEALCQLFDIVKNTETLPDVPSLKKRKKPSNDESEYNVGGGWRFSKGDNNFKLIIRKRTDDPEEENVTIGEDPPI